MAQVQCPNCGGYKVETESDFLEGEYERIGCLFRLALLCSFLLMLGIPFFYAVAREAVFLGKRRKLVGQIHKYTCYLCGYEWTWKTGDPLPQVNVRPDLIAKGEQRLEEERRRQAEAAAAAWWLQQQQKKK